MSFYDEIKSPLEDEDCLREVIEKFMEAQNPQYTTEKRHNYFYRKLVEDKPPVEGDVDFDRDIVEGKFYWKIGRICYEKLYPKIRNVDWNQALANDPTIKRWGAEIEEIKEKLENANKIERMNLEDEISEKEGKITQRKDKNFGDVQDVLSSCATYEEYLNRFNNGNVTDPEESRKYRIIWQSLEDKFFGGEGIMGFHVNPQNLKETKEKRTKGEMKFYVNAGIDTYEVAKYFMEKCEERGLNYYFKVVNPGEYNRQDKMCVFTEFKDAEKYLGILREIKKEHPEIEYKKPPVLSGRIDDYIGVGCDSAFSKGSYNSNMQAICWNAIEKVFPNMSKPQKDSNEEIARCKNELFDYISKHPEKMQELKNEIIEQVKAQGLDPDKICVREDVKEKLEGTSKEAGEEVATKTGVQPAIPATEKQMEEFLERVGGTGKFSNVKGGYEIDSDEMNEFYKRVAEEKANMIRGNMKAENKGNLNNTQNAQVNDTKNNSQLSQKDFINTFMRSYMRLESNSQYDNRAANEEGDMQAVVDIINKSKAGTLTKDDLLAYGITAQPMYDKNGQPIGTKGDYSEQSIDKMVRLVNAAKNLSLPGRNYIDEFININGINDIFEDMKNSKNVNSLIDRADIAKAQNAHGRGADRGLTPAEKEHIEAKKALEDLRNLGSGYSDERLYDMIRNDHSIGQGQMSMYNSKEELSLAKMLFRQDGKVPEDITEKMGEYALNVGEKENEAPMKIYDVKKATLSVRLSEIKAKIKEIKDKVVSKIKGVGAKENDDKNR